MSRTVFADPGSSRATPQSPQGSYSAQKDMIEKSTQDEARRKIMYRHRPIEIQG